MTVQSWLTFGTAAWKTNSVMSASVVLVAWIVMTAMFGFGLALSKVNSIFRPFLLYAVMGGIAKDKNAQVNTIQSEKVVPNTITPKKHSRNLYKGHIVLKWIHNDTVLYLLNNMGEWLTLDQIRNLKASLISASSHLLKYH